MSSNGNMILVELHIYYPVKSLLISTEKLQGVNVNGNKSQILFSFRQDHVRNPIKVRTLCESFHRTICYQSHSYHVQLADNPHTVAIQSAEVQLSSQGQLDSNAFVIHRK